MAAEVPAVTEPLWGFRHWFLCLKRSWNASPAFMAALTGEPCACGRSFYVVEVPDE